MIDANEMVEKVRAAVEARRSDELVIVARTDARAVEGLDLPDFDAFTTMIGLPEVRELEARFAAD